MPINYKKAKKVKDFVDENGKIEAQRYFKIPLNTLERYLRRYNELYEAEEGKIKLPNILLFDVETASPTAYTWGIWKQLINPNQIISDWFLLCWSAKWLYNNEMHTGVVNPVESLEMNDEAIARKLWHLIDDADILIGHNLDKFDVKKVNTRFAKYGLNPPSPYRTIDTLKVIRGQFSLLSNKLDEACKFFGIDGKLDTGGLELWKECVGNGGECTEFDEDGDKIIKSTIYDTNRIKDALTKMDRYCQQDVFALEELYLKIRSWIKSHPNMGIYNDTCVEQCPNCGGTDLSWGYPYVTPMGRYSGFRCKCGAYGRSRFTELSKDKRKYLTSPNAR